MSRLNIPIMSVLLALFAASLPASAALDLAPRATVIPAPIAFVPNQNWEGIAGQWNSFTLRIGTPQQYIRVFPSTASQQTWAVDTAACDNTWYFHNDSSSCSSSRGDTYNITESSSWEDIGWYSLRIEENLEFFGSGHFGHEKVSLGFLEDNGPSLTNTTVGTMDSGDFWLGVFGLHPRPTNFTSFDESAPSYMTLLKEQGLVPSLSFGYTAGAQYRFTKVLSSLTLGGHDASRYVANNITYGFAPDNERDLIVNLQTISMANGESQNLLLSTSIQVFIDSTVTELWLPLEVCQRFERAFGLVYDTSTDLYLVNDSLHNDLLSQNASVTFTIGPDATGGQTTDILFPYAAFDQIALPPYRNMENRTNYFPLRRADNSTQYTLGRTFLQEAYLIVDHERFNFSVHQVSWQAGSKPSLIAIHPPIDDSTGDHPSSSGLTTGAKIGIAVGIVGVVVLATAVLFCLWRRRRRQQQSKRGSRAKSDTEDSTVKDNQSERSVEGTLGSSAPPVNADGTHVIPKAELPANEPPRQEMSEFYGATLKVPEILTPTSPSTTLLGSDAGSTTLVEAENTERPIYEMEGDMPARSEADGRMLSEKESMIVRERNYNGTDPNPVPTPNTPTDHTSTGLSPVSAVSGDAQYFQRRQRTPFNPGDVAMVAGTAVTLNLSPASARTNGWDAPVSPMTPRGPVTLEETIISPLSPLHTEGSEGTRTLNSSDPDRKRFSYELDD